MNKKRLTVFTPTYNRAHTLPNLYHSIISQGCVSDLIWWVIDDGSIDNTEELIKEYIDENKVDIKYTKVKNGGKQRAMNIAFKGCQSELLMCVDSDDFLAKDACKKIITKWTSTNQGCQPVCGMLALKGSDEGKPLGSRLSDIGTSNILELYYKHKVKTDLDVIFDAKIIRNYSYPVADGEKFISEGYVYNQLSKKYTFLLLDEVTSICEYREDGYTKNIRKVLDQNPIGNRSNKEMLVEVLPNGIHKYIECIKYIVADEKCPYKKGLKACHFKFYYCLAYLPAKGLKFYLDRSQ